MKSPFAPPLVVLPEKLDYLRPLLEAFPEALARYRTQTGGDVAWNYHERACTGFLAAAAWLAGGVALEEWRHEKANAKSGRCDLYFRVGKRNISLEAKHCFCHLGTNALGTKASTEATVDNALAEARHDAENLNVGRDTRLAVVFACAALTDRTDTKRTPQELFTEWQEGLKEVLKTTRPANRTALIIVHGEIPKTLRKPKWNPLGLAVVFHQVSPK